MSKETGVRSLGAGEVDKVRGGADALMATKVEKIDYTWDFYAPTRRTPDSYSIVKV